MVKVTSIMGFDYYYRCTADGKIQQSSDRQRWQIASNFRGKRVDMTKHTIAKVKSKIAKQLDSNGDYNRGAAVVK